MSRRLFVQINSCFSHKLSSSSNIGAVGVRNDTGNNCKTINTSTAVDTDQTKLQGSKRRSTLWNVPEKEFKLEKVVLMRKITRYEYEKQLLKPKDESELKKYLTNRGSNYEALVQRHNEYVNTVNKLQEALRNQGIALKTVFKFDCEPELINWADAIFTAGGDGMFLMAASKVRDQSIPVIGINTDPIRSEGRLCLSQKHTANFDKAIERLLKGDFKWWWRQRIRMAVSGRCAPASELTDLHEQCLHFPEMRFTEHVHENETYGGEATPAAAPTAAVHRAPAPLPVLALNEVFVGESLSARMSFYEVSVDGADYRRQKSSGLTITTGTGSTSWFFNINHIQRDSVSQIIKIASSLGRWGVDTTDPTLMQRIADEFNRSLRFSPTDTRMAFTVRDPVGAGIFHVAEPRGFCEKMSIKSRMWDGWIVADGGVSFQFNDGAVMEVSINEGDALCCVALD